MDNQNHSSLLSGDSPFGVKPILDKTAFMNNICSCLDSCSAYIQALNSLCAAGTVLAHSLLQVFQELPPYRDLADQFVTMWEEMSKATAGASSGVKTETLMALQEVLNRLEEENSSMNVSQSSVHNTSVMENIKSVGSCLLSYVELQAQFSLSCWKSLSQISKNSESLIFFCLPRGFQDQTVGMDSSKNTSAIIRAPDELVVSIRKYFGQVLQKTIPISSSNQVSTALYSNFGENNESPATKSTGRVVSSSPQQMIFRGQQGLPPTNRWAHHSLHSSVSAPSSYGKINHKTMATSSPSEINSAKENSVSCELEEVLNLLSCQPNEPSKVPNSNDKTTFLNNVTNTPPTENINLGSGRLSLQSMPWCGTDNSKELTTSSDSAIHSNYPYQQVVSYEGKRTWPRMGSSGGGGEDQSPFSFGGWVWGHPERGLSNNIQTSEQAASTNIGTLQSSQKRNLVNWCNGWNSAPNENSSSDDGSNSNNGQDNEVFYPLSGLGYSDLVIQSDAPVSTIRQRRHSSNDGLPDGCNNLTLPEPSVDKRLNTCTASWQDASKSDQTGKTSTWPLKQSVNSRLGLDGLLLGGIPAASPTPPPLLLSQIDRPKVLDRQEVRENDEPCLRVASLVEHWGGGLNSQSDKNKDGKKYTLFGQMS